MKEFSLHVTCLLILVTKNGGLNFNLKIANLCVTFIGNLIQ